MLRLFEEHRVRKTQRLDGAWGFRTDSENVGKNNKWYLGVPSSTVVFVPQVWNTQRGLLTYEGIAWYEKRFFFGGGTLRLCFEAVMTEAEVYLDGQIIGSHYGGFSQFDFIVPDVASGEHLLILRVDNSFDEASIPQRTVDWFHHGGIIRGVSLEALDGVTILSNRLEYALSDDMKKAVCRPVVELYNAGSLSINDRISLYINGELYSFADVELNGGETREASLPEFMLENIRLWDALKPEIYDICFKASADDLCDRIGFRKIEVSDGKVLLNGKPIEFRGVNRHEEHPDWGFAFPMGLMKKDIDLALEMGCNAIRGSHYPNSQPFVDWLDSVGIMFWSEIPIWGVGFSAEALGNERVVSRGLEMHREMVKYYYNHPSVVIWGMHNEILTAAPEAYRMTELYYNFLKNNGGNRLVVYASCYPFEDICMEMCDAICLNQYHGWYGDYSDGAWERFVCEFDLHKKKLGFSGKPVIMSEFGAAAVAGYHDEDTILWSEEYQAKLIRHCLELFHTSPEFAGAFIWQFTDVRTCLEAGLNRARGFNNKGLLNEYRKPKLAYLAAKECYSRFKSEEN